MHAVQLIHSSCVPFRISIPVGQTCTHWWQSIQSPFPAAARSSPFLNFARVSPRLWSYATTIEFGSSRTPCNLPYGQIVVQTCSRKRAKTK